MIMKEKGRRTCLIIICQLNMLCGREVLYLLHQPASSWQVSWKPQKTSTKEWVLGLNCWNSNPGLLEHGVWLQSIIPHHENLVVRTHYTVWSGRRNIPAVFEVFLGHFFVSVWTAIKLATLHLSYLERSHWGKRTEYTCKGGQTPSKQATASV